ncbi:hypothetical protein EBZ80_13370, partial [bacterium]|nr:hypothetical protein [bacterium]
TGASWYEGNIKTCADKGMRLPVVYETTFESGSYTFPTEGGSLPKFAGSLGVPYHPIGFTWTASAWTPDANQYFVWNMGYLSWRAYWDTRPVRCVIPSIGAGAPVAVAGAGGASQDGASVSREAPGITITPPANLTAGSATSMYLKVTFQRATAVTLSDFTRNMVLVTTLSGDASAKVAISGTGLAARIIRLSSFTGNGTIVVSIDGNSVVDGAGNAAPPAVMSAPITVDTVPPTIAVSPPSATAARASSSVNYTVTYGGASDIFLTAKTVRLLTTGGASAAIAISGTGNTSRTITLSKFTGNGTIGIQLPAGTATDDGKNPSPETAVPTGPTDPGGIITVDNTPPGISISAPSVANAKASSSVTYTVTYTGAASVALDNASINSWIKLVKSGTANASVAVSGTGATSRTITLSSFTGNGSVGVSVLAGSATDAAGNAAPAAAAPSPVTVDTVAPVITIGKPSVNLVRAGLAASFTVSFSGASTIDLTPDKVTLNKTGTANASTVTVTTNGSSSATVDLSGFTGDGTIGITIPQGAGTDLA